MKIAALALVTTVSVLAAATLACESPIHDEAVAALGDEAPGVDTGEFHRYGQDCMVCHGGAGPGPDFVAASTVFATPDSDIPVKGATVILTDATGQTASVRTNCAGNFIFENRDFQPQFPLRAVVLCPQPDGSTRRVVMGSRINRDGGCAFCHAAGEASGASPGQVYCASTQPNPPYTVPVGERGGQCEGGPSHGGAP